MHRLNWKNLISFMLLASVLAGLLPVEPAVFAGNVLAEEQDTFAGSVLADKTDAGSDDLWLYEIDENGYACVLGYADQEAVSLTIPRVLGGAFVVRISENAFSENRHLQKITLPACVSAISDKAFSSHDALTVCAPFGSAGLEFAKKRGFLAVSASEYDFLYGIKDLSEMTGTEFRCLGAEYKVAAPYADLILEGDKVFLPATDLYPNGFPAEVLKVKREGYEAVVSLRMLDFTQTLASYSVSNVPAMPDFSRMVILAEGFTPIIPMAKRAFTGSASKEISFAVNYDTGKGKSISGKLSYEPNYEFSVSYEHFKLEEFSYKNSSKTSLSLTYKDSAEIKEHKEEPSIIKFAKLPLTTPTLVSVWLEISLVVSVEGEVTIETSMTTTETMTWTPHRGTSTSKTKEVDMLSVNAAIGVSAELKMAVVVNLGFSATDFNVDIAELSVSVGVKAMVKFLDVEVDCKELDVDGVFTVSVKLGILSSDWPRVSLDITLFSLKWDALTLHLEFTPSFKIVRECTKDIVTVHFAANGGTGAPNPVTVKKGSVIKETKTPVRGGYRFTGWYADNRITIPWQMGTDTVSEEMTLYAGWEKVEAEPTATPKPSDAPEAKPIPNIPVQSASSSLSYLTYTIINKEEVTISGYTGKPESLTIPSTIEGLPVTRIGNGAFSGCNSLKRVKIPSSVDAIGMWAFLNCKSLVIADIPFSLAEMGDNCFAGCTSLMEAHIPGDLEVIGKGMFSGCTSLQTATVGSGLTLLPGTTFDGCKSLINVNLPSSIESIGASAFYNCDELRNVYLPSSLKSIGMAAFSGCDKLEYVSIPAGCETIGSSAFEKCISLPEIRLQGALKELGGFAFFGCTSLEKAYFSCPLETLPANCFKECTLLTDVTLPDGLITIGGSAFEKCKALCQIDFPSTLEKVGNSAFINCTALEKVGMNNGLVAIEANAFADCTKLQSPDFPFTLQSVGTSAFSGCDAIEKVEMNGSGIVLGSYAFHECESLTSISLSGVVEIKSFAFERCKKLSDFSLSGVETIGDYAFNDCDALEEIALPEGLLLIGGSAFYSCDLLKKVSFPLSVSEIESNAFNRCIALEEVKLSGNLEKMGTYVFQNCTSLEYAFFNTPSLSSLPNSTFRSCTALKEAVLTDSMTKIEAGAFYGCSALMDIVWPSKLTHIETDAFNKCAALEKLYLPEGVTSIKNSAFNACTSLTDLRLPKSLKTLGSSVFANCTKLEAVRVPGGIKANSGYTFQNCTSLVSVTLADGLTKIANSMFLGCSSLVEVLIPDSVTTIEASAFYRCGKLPNITLSNNVTSIGSSAFSSCSAFGCVYVYSLDSAAAKHFAAKYPKVIVALVGDRVAVSFDSMGGSVVPGVYSAPGAIVVPPSEPEKEDYTFTGWYADTACTDMWLFPVDKVPAGGMTLYAGWNYTPKDMKYLRNGVGVTLTDYSGDESALEIPKELDGYPVTRIGSEALNDAVTVVHIPACVTDISPTAFRWAENLTTITVDESNTAYYAKDGVLYKADGTLACYPRGRTAISFTPADGTKAIGERAFYDVDSLKRLTFPASLRSMGAYAVYDCDNLESVVFESDLKPGTGCFLICSRELDIKGPANAPKLSAYADQNYLDFNEYSVIFMENGQLLGAYRVRAGGKVGQPPKPEDGEMTFAGWSETGKETNLWNFASSLMPAKDLTLHAVWRLDFTTRTTKDGGIELVTYTGDKDVVHVPDEVDGKKVVSIADDCFPDESVTLTGNDSSVVSAWAEKKGMTFVPLRHTVAFVTGGGTQVNEMSLLKGQKVPKPYVIRQGYALEGWYTDPYFGKRFDFDVDVMPGHDLTLYAAWTKENEAQEIPFTYEETDGGLMITGYIGETASAAIPERINGIPVISIAPYAFHGNRKLTGLTIPGSVKTIHEGALSQSAVSFVVMEAGVECLAPFALSDCAHLTSLTLPDTIRTLGHHALQGLTALSAVAIPEGVTEIPDGLLSGCTFLEGVQLPSSLETIGAQAFSGCTRIKMLALPSNLRSVDISAFKGLTALSAFEANGKFFRSTDGVLLSADGKTLVSYPEGKLDEVWTAPSGVETIRDGALAGAAFTQLTLPDSVTAVGKGAMRSCVQLETFNGGNGLSLLGANALSGAMSLNTVKLGALTYIEPDAIPALEGLTIYAPVGSPAQAYASQYGIRFEPELRWTFSIPQGIAEIEEQAFMGASFYSVYCPDGLKVIGDEAFAQSLVACIRLPESATTISKTAFSGLSGLIIVAPAGSAAHAYAQAMGISFIAE